MTKPAFVMSEAQLQSAVIELARLRGWRVAHSRPAMNQRGVWSTPISGDPGFPDLVLARHGRVIFAELKSELGRIGKAQSEWIGALKGPGNEVYVWLPRDWTSGSINKILSVSPIR